MRLIDLCKTGMLAAALATGASAAQAVPELPFFNLENAFGTPYYISAEIDGPLGQSFTTLGGASFFDLSLSVFAEADGTGSFTLTLNADVGNMPGGVLATIGTMLDTDLYNGSYPVDGYGFATFAGISATLAANTRYWIVATDNCSNGDGCDYSTSLWDQTDNPLDVSVNATPTENEWAYFQGGNFWAGGPDGPVDSPGFIMSITTYAAPEPATLALLGAGLVGLGVFRRRAAKTPA